MKPFFIGIAGGSGSGKTALAKALKKELGKRASILHLDNYQKFGEKLPLIAGMKNWDHPSSVEWYKLIKDLTILKAGKKIIVEARNQKDLKINERPKVTSFAPTKIIIIEGYLLFYKKSVRDLLDFEIFLEVGDKIRIARRTKFKNPAYIREVLLPMHCQYIEPTKKYADLILNIEELTIKNCVRRLLESYRKYFINF